MSPEPEPLRFGILGAASIAPMALLEPARTTLGCDVVAIAARDRSRAEAFAARHGIPCVESSYNDLLQRSDIDAVYVPLVVSMHREWCERALLAGKHVLCEKPMTMNTAEAERLVGLAGELDLVLAQAFHYRYHPMALRILAIVERGEIGMPYYAEAVLVHGLSNDLPEEAGAYWDARLGGSAARHNGCYPAHILRAVLSSEPVVVGVNAIWWEKQHGADAALDAELRFPGDVRARLRASFLSERRENWLRLKGSEGEIFANNFVLPHLGGAKHGRSHGYVLVTSRRETRRETFPVTSTYAYQLQAFVKAVRTGATLPTAGEDIIRNTQLLDSMLAGASAAR